MAGNVEKNYQERILKVLIYIQNHLDDPLSLEALAEIAHFSPYHFHRVFTASTGESVKSYLRRLRLERATRDLLFTELSLMDIALRAGYDTQQSFHRSFKEMFETTPLDYREKKYEAIFSHPKKDTPKDVLFNTVVIKNIDTFQVAFVRHVGNYDKILETWFLLANEIGLSYFINDTTKKISICHDSPDITPQNKLRYDACVSFEALTNLKPSGNIGVQTIRGGKYAVITHEGALDQIESTYEKLFGLWLPNSGYEPDDYPNFILHRNIPLSAEVDSSIVDIYLPIK